ncbi:MAG: alpha/beta hydrolase family protein [Alphaproteobacteria bacterium]
MKRFLLLLLLLVPALFFLTCDGQNNDEGVEYNYDPEPGDRSDPWDEPGDWNDDDAVDDDDTPPGGPAFDPMAKGPYEVGNTTRLFVDNGRRDFWGDRQLLVDIWYPAAPETAGMEPDIVYNFLGKWFPLLEAIFGLVLPEGEMQNFYEPTRSVRDAPIAEGGPWPVAILGHGNGGIRFQNMHLCEHLASHGFVVISADHTGNAAVTPLPSDLIIYNPIAIPFEFIWRQSDIAFLIDTAYWLNDHDNFGTFIGKIDADRAAAIGHSFGAITSLEEAKHDTRIDAVVSLSGWAFPGFFENYTAPTLCFWGWEDRTLIELNVVQAMQTYEKIPVTKAWIGIRDAGHYSFTDVCDLIPTLMGNGDGCGIGHRHSDGSEFEFIEPEVMYDLTNYYVTAFLAWALRGDDTWDLTTTNIWPEQIHMYWSENP